MRVSQLRMAKSILQQQAPVSPASSQNVSLGIHIAAGGNHTPNFRPNNPLSSPTPNPTTTGFLPAITEEYSPHWRLNLPTVTICQPSLPVIPIQNSIPPLCQKFVWLITYQTQKNTAYSCVAFTLINTNYKLTRDLNTYNIRAGSTRPAWKVVTTRFKSESQDLLQLRLKHLYNGSHVTMIKAHSIIYVRQSLKQFP